MISKTILQSCAMLGNSAAEILTKTNEALCSNNQVQMFVTVWLGILEISTGMLTCANAGHEYPVLKRTGGVFELYKDKHSFPVGGMEGIRYKEYTLRLNPGDKLFLYTDGLTEATNEDYELFGTDRILEALNADPDISSRKLLQNMNTAVDAFVGKAEQADDLTMMAIRLRNV
jgi:sigma-B regulation protein RsbU (phosphoserine phosphatase)